MVKETVSPSKRRSAEAILCLGQKKKKKRQKKERRLVSNSQGKKEAGYLVNGILRPVNRTGHLTTIQNEKWTKCGEGRPLRLLTN